MDVAQPLDRRGAPTGRGPTDLAAALVALDGARAHFAGGPEWAAPTAWRRFTAASGIAGLDLPVRVGGRAFSALAMAECFARCGGFSLELRDVPGGGHARFLLGAPSRRFDHVLRGVAAGDEFLAIAITEPDAGSDLHGLMTTAVPAPDGYVLSGRKLYVARLAEASRAIVFAGVPRAGAAQSLLTAFLLPLDLPGMSTRYLEAVGLEGVSFGGLDLDAVRVPASLRIGGEGQAFALFLRHFTYWRAATAAAAIGCARAAIDQAVTRLQGRQAFGGPIGRFTHLQQQLAEHAARLHMAWLLVTATMARIDARQPAWADAAMAKAEAVESAVAAVDWAMRVHGARGHSTEVDLERRLRGLLALRVADGTTDVLRGQVARAILGDDLYDLGLGRPDSHRVPSVRRRFW